MASTDRRLQALIDELLKTHEPAIRRAFIEAMQDARNAVDLAAVIDALARGDISGAMQVIEFSRSFLAPLDQEIGRAYYRAGQGFTGLLMASRPRGVTVEVRFDPGNPRAAGWLTQHSSTLVTEIVDDQRVAVRAALAARMEAGVNPRTAALDVVGRIDRVAKQRVGGVIGLTSQQSAWVENARAELVSGDPAQMRAYLERKLRDRRFDKTVMKAISEGKPVSGVDATRIVGRYSDRMLEYRGKTIALTESLTALSYAQDEGARQLIESSGLQPENIVKNWIARLDGHTRDTHVSLDGQKVGLDGVFVSPSGARMRFPRDSSMSAPVSEIARCRCVSSYSVAWQGVKG